MKCLGATTLKLSGWLEHHKKQDIYVPIQEISPIAYPKAHLVHPYTVRVFSVDVKLATANVEQLLQVNKT